MTPKLKANIVLVDDDKVHNFYAKKKLSDNIEGSIHEFSQPLEALEFIASQKVRIDLIVLDVFMPEISGMQFIQRCHALGSEIPIAILSSSDDSKHIIECMSLGAVDFMNKPLKYERVFSVLNNIQKVEVLHTKIAALTQNEALGFSKLIGYRRGLKSTVRFAQQAASSDISVILTGESGSGKGLLAELIHKASARHQNEFVAVNCAALPENLVESTLFGHMKGAFTGAVKDQVGKFQEAHQGTLFLDEVGELSLPAQAKLLRALQDKEIEPVGSSKSISVNTRVISATHRDLVDDVRKGRFREDLFYRLNIFKIEIPALRQRAEDLEELSHYFLKYLAAKENKKIKSLSPEAISKIKSHNWPGNIRELENVIYRAVVVCDSEVLGAHQIEIPKLSLKLEPISILSDKALVDEAQLIRFIEKSGKFRSLKDIEDEILEKALKSTFSIRELSQQLDMAPSTLYKKISEKKKNLKAA